jgi:hypothetical protein
LKTNIAPALFSTKVVNDSNEEVPQAKCKKIDDDTFELTFVPEAEGDYHIPGPFLLLVLLIPFCSRLSKESYERRALWIGRLTICEILDDS